jgi:NAD(P)-dependent dehydrogenase (short-subunit alcohol dehydrogenase family)
MEFLSRFSLSDRIAVVIGGSSGIGRQIALGFRDAGATVIPIGRKADKVDEVVRQLRASEPRSDGHAVDVSDLGALRGLVTNVVDRHGRVDILVNSQGITLLKPAETFDEHDFDSIMATNLKSVFFACTEFGKHMLARGEGCIINIASIASFLGFQLSAPYTASKHGVVGLTRTLAAEWAARGVRVNAIAPGFFMTALNRDKMDPERKTSALRRTPMGRFGELEELVNAALYFASPGASFVTGEVLSVDGGYTAAGL